MNPISMNHIDKITSINSTLRKENMSFTPSNEYSTLLKSFKQWWTENGVVTPYTEFPVFFSPLRYWGCKTKTRIPGNTAILYVPYSIIIDSRNINIKLSESLNLSTHNSLKWTLFLLSERQKGEASKYKPYIDMILSNDFNVFPVNWQREELKKVNSTTRAWIDEYKEEIIDLYEEVVLSSLSHSNSNSNSGEANEIDFDMFKAMYLFVISRQFYISDKISFLIPFADWLNHNPNANVKYEVYDARNYVMKYTKELDEDNIKTNWIATDCSGFHLSLNINSWQHQGETRDEEGNNSSLHYNEYDGLIFDEDNYFVISTNNGHVFGPDEEVYNNYGKNSNEELLINFGFCWFDNRYDYTKVQLNIPGDDASYIELIQKKFGKYIIEGPTEAGLKLMFRVKKTKICKGVVYFFWMNRWYEENKDTEIETLFNTQWTCVDRTVVMNCISFYESVLAVMDLDVDTEIKNVETIVNKAGTVDSSDVVQINISIFNITQSVNVFIQNQMWREWWRWSWRWGR